MLSVATDANHLTDARVSGLLELWVGQIINVFLINKMSLNICVNMYKFKILWKLFIGKHYCTKHLWGKIRGI